MSSELEQIAAEVAEIKTMLKQLLMESQPAPALSPIMETLRTAEALGLDPVQAMDQFRVTGRRGRPATKKPSRRGKHV